MSSPLRQRYQNAIQAQGFQSDQAQLAAIERLGQLATELTRAKKPRPGWLRAIFGGREKPIKGVYLWGGVGRGKTFIMDLFYDSLPFADKHRTHFHRFMRRVHGELTQLKGSKNPLDKVADRFASEARVICFDEFFVADITDAMILANLLESLFARGVVLVATSNIVPEGLYKDGLQRSRFLPAIQLLLENMDVLNVDAGVDYRLRVLSRAELFYSPLNHVAKSALSECFAQLVSEASGVIEGGTIEVESRHIPVIKRADDIIWFDFKALCDGPRSQNDYIELAREFHTVIVENVPPLGRSNDDQARRFINLVDEFYDRRVKLIVSAANPIEALYGEGKLEFEFARTVSRMREMQSREYLALEHRP